MKSLTEKQLHTKLNNYYKKHYGEQDTDNWYVNPKENVWKFERDGKTIVLEYDEDEDKVREYIKITERE